MMEQEVVAKISSLDILSCFSVCILNVLEKFNFCGKVFEHTQCAGFIILITKLKIKVKIIIVIFLISLSKTF